MTVGYVTGESRPDSVTCVSSRPLEVGEYVVVASPGGDVLGLVEGSSTANPVMGGARNFEEASELVGVAAAAARNRAHTSRVMALGYLGGLREGRAVAPSVAPEPGAEVSEAGPGQLGGVFAPGGAEWVRLGSLLRNRSVEARADLNRVVSRHLGVLAMTGMGKSNLVSLLAKRVGEIEGTAVIFDYHDDYGGLAVPGANLVEAKINPRRLDVDGLADILEIRPSASQQLSVLRRGFTEAVRRSSDFWAALGAAVCPEAGPEGPADDYAHARRRVRDKIEDSVRRFSDVVDPGVDDPVGLIREGRINVVDISGLSERQANVAVAYYVQEILADRKRAVQARRRREARARPPRFSAPVLAVIEEAHVFVPRGEDTKAKYWVAKAAREGRKFGLGLAIVSQRPRGIDPAILGQMGSLAVMRMVQEDDQAQVAAAAETLSRGLLRQLTSLNVGDAVLVGQWVRLPSVVHVDEVAERPSGRDRDAVAEWAGAKRLSDAARAAPQGMIRRDLMD